MRRCGDPSGKVYIVKESRRGPNELEILRFLRSISPSSDHIITLVETTKSNKGKCIVLPERRSVDEQLRMFANGGSLHGKFPQLSRDLVAGVLFLHESGIAHLDINPRNLVFTDNFRLQIIDFDVAVRVNGDDDEIDYYCGTKGWMAPEIGEKDGPRLMYKPRLADKYSCGCVIAVFVKRHGKPEDDVESFAKRLMDRNPEKRPSLLAWPTSSNQSQTRSACDCWSVSPSKRPRVEQ